MEVKADHTYRVFFDGGEVEHFHCTRVHGRRIEFGVTAQSALFWQTTRTRWKKLVSEINSAGGTITEEATALTTDRRMDGGG